MYRWHGRGAAPWLPLAPDGAVILAAGILAPSDGVICLDLKQIKAVEQIVWKTLCRASPYFFPVNIVSSREIDHCLKGPWVIEGHKSKTSAPARIIVIHDPDIVNLTEAPTKSDRREFDNINIISNHIISSAYSKFSLSDVASV